MMNTMKMRVRRWVESKTKECVIYVPEKTKKTKKTVSKKSTIMGGAGKGRIKGMKK